MSSSPSSVDSATQALKKLSLADSKEGAYTLVRISPLWVQIKTRAGQIVLGADAKGEGRLYVVVVTSDGKSCVVITPNMSIDAFASAALEFLRDSACGGLLTPEQAEKLKGFIHTRC